MNEAMYTMMLFTGFLYGCFIGALKHYQILTTLESRCALLAGCFVIACVYIF